MGIGSRLSSAWNAFIGQPSDGASELESYSRGATYTTRPDRSRSVIRNERTIIASIYTRLSTLAASVEIKHVKHDDNDRYVDDISSGLNNCLTLSANIDQSASFFRQDIFYSLLEKGTIAIVPVDTTLNPNFTGGFDIKTMRVGEITQWYPQHVRVLLYNDRNGKRQEVLLSKNVVGVVENPFYTVMNMPNSTLQRLTRKLQLLDIVDDQTSSGKLDLIIQLPYVVKSDTRREQAEKRRDDVEFQLRTSQHGIAYIDGTEKITQLNRPVDNQLLEQINTLIQRLYVELGLTPEVMNGTANEATMINFLNGTIEPLVRAVVEELMRKFLTQTARTQRQSIDFFRDPFKLLPLSDIAELADKLTRNEIITANEMRQKIGFKPSSEPKADQLINSNMPVDDTGVAVPGSTDPNAPPDSTQGAATGALAATDTRDLSKPFDGLNDAIDKAFADLGLDDSTDPDTSVVPQAGPADPSVISSALDTVDSSIDQTFSGLEG